MIVPLLQLPNGGKVEMYSIVNRAASDFQNVFDCCRLFAEMGKKTLITPAFLVETIGNPLYEEIYATLRGTQYWGKCPDFNVDGLWYEHEGFDRNKDLSDPNKRADTFSLMMRRGLKQSDRVVLEDCGAGHPYMKRNIYRRIQFEHQHISEVIIKTVNGFETVYKS